MGTMLQNAGLPLGQLPETYNLLHPDIVTDIHRQYLQAGARVVFANTFGANAHKLAGSGVTPEQAITTGVRCAKQAAKAFDGAYVTSAPSANCCFRWGSYRLTRRTPCLPSR